MALSPWGGYSDPFSQMNNMMMQAFDPRFVGRAGDMMGAGPLTMAPSAGWTTLSGGMHAMDIIEKENHYEVLADAPGMNPEDISVECHQGMLTIRGQHKEVIEERDKRGRMHRTERSVRSFNRSFTLPQNANEEGIDATLDRGVLRVMVPKVPEPEKPQPRRIAVKPHGEMAHEAVHVGAGEGAGMGTGMGMGQAGATTGATTGTTKPTATGTGM